MDQHVVTDWKAYFDSLPSSPSTIANVSPIYVGKERASVTYVKNPSGDLEEVRFEGEEGNLFDRAKEVWEANGGPEMWLFSHLGSPPWHVEARPKAKRGK